MIPPELLAEQLAIDAHISKLTAQQVVRFWKRIDPVKMDNPAVADFMTGAIRQITSAYGELAAVRAAEFYDEVREIGGFSGKAAVPVAGRPPEEQLKAVVRWGIGPLWEETPRPDAALKRLVGSTQRLSLQPGRQTIYQMVKRDRIRYAHVPQGKTCAFCMMLASRGAVYWSDQQPQYHDHCVPGGTLVNGPSTELALRRWYEGEVVIIQTSDGDELTITPNHPVLTREAWVPAGELHVGQEIVKRAAVQGDQLLVPDEQDRPSCIENVWRALRVNGLAAMPVSAEDFHGDGAGTEGNVHVVAPDGLFADEGDIARRQLLSQILSPGAGASAVANTFSREGDSRLVALTVGCAANGGVGSSGLRCALSGRERGGSQSVGDLGGAPCDVLLSKPPSHHAARYAVSLREDQFRSPGQIRIDQTIWARDERLGRSVGIRTRFDPPSLESDAERLRVHAKLGSDLLERLAGGIEFSSISHLRRVQSQGHVYNLQTAEGWYSANNIIISNCDCQTVPVSTPDDLPDINRQLHDEWVSATRGQRDQVAAWREYVQANYPTL